VRFGSIFRSGTPRYRGSKPAQRSRKMRPCVARAEFLALPRPFAHSRFRLLQLLYLIPSSLQGSDQAVVADKVAGANDYEIIAVTLEETFYLR